MEEFSSHVGSRLFDRISLGLVDFSGVLLALVVLLVNIEIGLRYFFGHSLLITDEYTGYFFVWMSLLGFGYALQNGQLLHVDAFVGRLRGRPRHGCELVGALAGLAVAAVSTYACSLVFLSSWEFGTRSIQPFASPLWVPQLVLPLSTGWLSVLYLRLAVLRARSLFSERGAA